VATRRTVTGELWHTYPGVELVADGAEVLVKAPPAAPARLDDAIAWEAGPRFGLLGRHSDLVKLGGRRASLSGLNRILNAVPGVADGVFVAPDDLDSRPTARMLAFVVAPDHSPLEILRALRGRIDPVFLPRRIVKLERLPRNEIGKLRRQALAALAEA
jgi:acyl-coenzyme A synthetase/AMP-(fatty) acid ligase